MTQNLGHVKGIFFIFNKYLSLEVNILAMAIFSVTKKKKECLGYVQVQISAATHVSGCQK